jgi:integrase
MDTERTQATVNPEAWAAAQVDAVASEVEEREKPRRKRRKVRGIFLKPGKEAGVWWIRWWCNYGHRHEERIGPKGLAEEMVEKRRVAVKTQDFCLTRDRERKKREKPTLFRDAVTRYLAWAEEHRPRSYTFREKALEHLKAAFGDKALTGITRADVESYQTRRRDAGAAPGTVNRERSVLSHVFTKAIAWGLAAENPVTGSDRQKEADEKPRPLSPDEEARLFSVLPAHYKPWVTLALHTGLRLGELRHQAWRDIDLPEASLTVTRPKSGKAETLPLNATARAVLASLERTAPVIFPTLPKKLTDLFIRYAVKAKLEDVTFHCLRDTYISRLAPHVSTPTLMALARHRDYRTTRRYVQVDGAHLRAAVERLAEGSGGELSPQKGDPALCANMNETLPPSEFRVEGGEGMRDERPA